jgi:hypothetical protein
LTDDDKEVNWSFNDEPMPDSGHDSKDAEKTSAISRATERLEILSLLGSAFLFLSAYLLYVILEFIQTANGTHMLPEGAKFVFPNGLAIVYYFVLAVGMASICAGQRLFYSEIRYIAPDTRLDTRTRDFFYSLGAIIDVGLCSVVCLGGISAVYFQPFNYSFPPIAVRSTLSWQLGFGGVFFGLITLLALIPGTAISLALRNVVSVRKAGLNGRRNITFFIFSTVVMALSLFGLTIASLVSLLA